MHSNHHTQFRIATKAYELIIQDIFKTVGFIGGGFCPEPCEHTTLQDTDPEMYMKLYKLWISTQTVNRTVKDILNNKGDFYGGD